MGRGAARGGVYAPGVVVNGYQRLDKGDQWEQREGRWFEWKRGWLRRSFVADICFCKMV